MSALFYKDTVALLRPTSTSNRAGEAVLNYDGLRSAEGVPRTGVQVRAQGQAEVVADDRETAVSEWIVQTEPGSPDWDVRATDWVRLPSNQIAAVVGMPARATDPVSGEFSHLQIRVREARS